MRSIAMRLVEALRERVEVLGGRADLRAELLRSWISGRDRIRAGRPTSSASPRLGNALVRGLRERALGLDQAAEVGRRSIHVGQERRALVGQGAEVDHQQAQLAQGVGQEPQACGADRWRARPSPRRSCWPPSMKSANARARGTAGRAPGRSRARAGRGRGSAGRGSPARSSVSLRAGLARWMTSLRSSPRPASPTPSSLSRIAKRWRYGRRRMSLSRSMSTGALLWSTDSRRSPLPAPSLIVASWGPRREPGSHSTKRLSDQALEADLAGGVRLERGETSRR